MRILDRYLLREFTGYLALGLIGFISLFTVVDVIDKIDVFLDQHSPGVVWGRGLCGGGRTGMYRPPSRRPSVPEEWPSG